MGRGAGTAAPCLLQTWGTGREAASLGAAAARERPARRFWWLPLPLTPPAVVVVGPAVGGWVVSGAGGGVGFSGLIFRCGGWMGMVVSRGGWVGLLVVGVVVWDEDDVLCVRRELEPTGPAALALAGRVCVECMYVYVTTV